MTGVASGVARPYRRLFAEPVLRRLVAADVCARLPQGMTSLTLLLVAAQHAPMAVAGLVLAGYTLGAAVTAPVRGRLADRRGLFGVAAACGAGYALALLGLLACSLARAPAGLLVLAGTAAGLLTPPLSPGVRSLWAVYAAGGLRQAAFALDAAVFDLCYLAGPVLASALAAGLAPAAALGLVLVLTAAAVAAVPGRSGPARPGRADRGRPDGGRADRGRADRGTGDGPGSTAPRGRPHLTAPSRTACDASGGTTPRAQPHSAAPSPGAGSLWGPLRSAALRRLLVTAALTNAALAATEVALTAYARDHHALWASGPLLAGVAAGSIAGSLFLGTRAADGGAHRRLPWLLAGYTAGLAGLTAASLYPPLLVLAAPLAGLCLGPALATLFSATASAAPHGSGTEAQAWINSIMNGGAAGGAALAGLTASSPVLGLSLAAAAAAAAMASAALIGPRRR